MAQANTVELNYYVLGETHDRVMSIVVSREAKIPEVRSAIVEDYKPYGDIVEPVLFKTDRADDDLPEHRTSLDVILKFNRRVKHYWPPGEQISNTRVQLLVQAESVIKSHLRPPRVPSPQDTLGDLLTGTARLQLAQDATAQSIRNGKAPSDASKPKNFLEQQSHKKNGKVPILNGRPYNNTGLPIQLFHNVFEKFTNGATCTTKSIEPSEYAAAEALLEVAQAIYMDESSRQEALFDIFERYYNMEFSQTPTSRGQADGVIKAGRPGYKGYSVIIQLRNEIGCGASDPSIQAAQSYAMYWSEMEGLMDMRRMCCCPTLIIAMAGPWLCILGAVYLEQVVVQPLTEFMWLGRQPWSHQRLDQLAHMFHSLTGSVKYLNTYYETLTTSEDPARFFPYHRRYIGESGREVELTYEDYLLPRQGEERVKAIFKARTSDGNVVVVKFVQTYCARAHRLLADAGLAPTLLFDSEKLAPTAGDRMIVMEYVPNTDLYDYLHLPSTKPESTELAAIRGDIEKALDILHGESLVFGDLRSPNVIVVKRGEKTGGMLVDFDWCGTECEAKYPPGMNIEDLMWPEGATKGKPLLKAHDIEMLGRLFLETENRTIGLS